MPILPGQFSRVEWALSMQVSEWSLIGDPGRLELPGPTGHVRSVLADMKLSGPLTE